MEGLPMAQIHFWKYSIKCEKICSLFYSELKRHNVSYIYYRTDNIHIVLENINTVLMRLKKRL